MTAEFRTLRWTGIIERLPELLEPRHRRHAPLGKEIMMLRARLNAVLFAIILPVVGGCTPEPFMPVSDVPCFELGAWPDEVVFPLVRPEVDGGHVLLLTSLTFEQSDVDREDDIVGNGPHGPVYRYDVGQETFELVENAAWEEGSGVATDCGSVEDSGPFLITSPNKLDLDGEIIEVEGGTVLRVGLRGERDVAAVLSTNGHPGLPFVSNGGATGQHYHQLYSSLDGRKIGPALRLPLGGRIDRPPPKLCWSGDERIVIYWEYEPDAPGVHTMCFVDVGDVLADVQDP